MYGNNLLINVCNKVCVLDCILLYLFKLQFVKKKIEEFD